MITDPYETVENDDRPTFYYCYLTVIPQPGYPGDKIQALNEFLQFLNSNSRTRPEHSYAQAYMDCLLIYRASEHEPDFKADNWCARYGYCERFYDFASSRLEYSDEYRCKVVVCAWDSNDGCIQHFKPTDFMTNLSLVFPDLVFILDMAHAEDVERSGQYFCCCGRYTFRPAKYCHGDWAIPASKLLIPIEQIFAMPEEVRGLAFVQNLIADDGLPLCSYGAPIPFVIT